MSIRLSSKALKKIVAASVTAAFFFTTVGEPYAQTSFWADRQAARTRPAPSAGDTRQLLSTISWPKESLNPILGAYRLPSTLGTVVETHTGSPDAPVLIHLQDAHGLYGAQYNASKVLDGLFHAGWSGGQALPVYQEGGAGPANIDWLSAFPDDEIKEQIGLAHLRHGDITGEEYRALVSSSGTFRLMGVETKDLYKRNLAARHETAKDRAQADVHIGAIQTRLSNLKSKIYPPALLAIDRPLQAYAAQSITFIDYIQTLATLAPRAFESPDYPNLNSLLRLTQLEAGLDFRGLAEERERLVQKMATRLTTDDVQGLVAKATEVREGRRPQGEFYQALLSVADQLKQQGEDLPTRALRNYVGYLRLSDSLRHEELLTEAEQLRGRLLERYSPNDRVWRLVNLDRRVALERLLWKQEMTPDQYAAFKEQGPLDWAEVEKYVAEQESACGLDTFRSVGAKPDTLAWTLSLPKVRAFYELAVERDIALVMNTLGDMKANGVKRGVLIAGGFHTPGLTRLFRQEGVSYAVVQPNFETGEALPSSKDLVISQTPARLAHTVREANLMVTPPAGSPGAADNPTYSYALKMVAMSAINALSKKKNEASIYLSRIREWMATSASRMNMRVISVFEIGETSETRVFVVVGQVGKNREPVAFFYREGAGERVPAISFQVGTKDISTTKALDLSRQLPRGFVEPGRLSAWVAGLIQDLKGVSDSSKIADIQEKAAESLSELGAGSTNLLLDFLKTADGGYSLPQSAEGDKALKAFDTALKQSAAQAPSRMRLFFENLRSRNSLALGTIVAFISGLAGASELFLGAAGTMVASSGALLPMIAGLLLATATVGITVGYRPVVALANGLKQKWVSIAVTPAKTQKSILPLVAGLVIGGGLFLWGLPMGILFLKDVLSPSVVDLLSPVLLILDVTSSISFLMMALVVGYKVYFSSDYKDAKWAGVAKVAAPAVAMVFTSGVLFAFFAAFAAWNLATSDAARQAKLLRPVADRLNQSADALKRISPAWFGALLSGRSPPEQNRWVSLLLWTPSKLIHVAKDLAGTFKSFAFQSAIDLYAIYEGNPTKTENEMTLAEKWFREVMTTLRGTSQPGSLRYAFAQGAGIVIGVGFYTQATVSRRLGLMLLSTASSFVGTQIVGAFVWVAALGGGLGGVVMAVFFLYQSYQYYKKFGHERQGFKGINVRMVIFGLLGLGALVTSGFVFSGMGSEALLGHFYAFNPVQLIGVDVQQLANAAKANPSDHWAQFFHASVSALGPSAVLGSALFGLLLTVKGMAAQTQLANAAEKKVILSTLDRVFGWTRYALPLVRYYWKETDLEKRRAFASKTSSSILGLVSVGPEVAGAVGIAAWAGGLDVGLAPAAEVINRIEGGKGIMGLSDQLTQSVSVSLFGEADWINLHNYTVVGTGYTTQELVQMNLLLSGIHSMEAEIAAQRAEMATQGKSSQQIEGLQSKVTALRESLREIQSKSLRNSKTNSANLKKGFRGLLPMLFDTLIASAKAEEIEPAVSSAEVPGLPTPAAQSLPGPLASSLTSDQGSNQGQADHTVGSEQPVAHVKTIKGNLNLRAGPGVDSAWLASLPKGREITVLPETIGTKTPGWVIVRAVMENGKSVQGYVDARFVQFAAPSLPSSENRVPLNTRDEKPNSVAGFSVTSHYHAERGFNPETGKPYVHSGTDIACPVGTPLVAPKDLTILEAGSDGSRGHYVVVGIAGESFTFMHLNEPVQLKRGDRVPEKTIFAQTGHTGNARGNNGGDHVHVEYRDRDGQPQDPLSSPITADFLAQGRSAKTEVASVREIPSGRVVRVTDALAKVGETTSVQVANLKSDSARLFAQEILAKFFKGDLEIAASRLQSKEIIPGGVKEILQLVGAGSGGGTVHVLTGTTLEPDQVKKKNTAELQINLLIKAVAWSDDLTNDARVRKHAAKMRDLIAEIETKVNVPGTIIDYFLDISSVDAQLKLVRDEIRKKSIQKQEIEEKIVKGQENATNLRQRFDTDLNRLKISLATLEGQREEFVMKLFILVPGLWPEGTTWAQAKADAQTTKFDIDETQIETYLRNAGADNASNLRIQLAREKAALLKAAIPAHYNTDAEIKGVLGILRLVAGKATGGLSMALDAVARVTLYDPEREAKENAGVWAYARAVVEAEEIERQEKYAQELSHRERDHSLRQVASQRESVARNELEMAAFRERVENGQLAYRDLLSKQKSDLETKQALERLKRESLRMVGQAAKNNFNASNVTPVDSEASAFDRVKGFFGGGILDLFRNPDAKAEMKRAEMEKENERLFAPVDIKDPTFMTAARMLLDRSHQLRQARSRVKEIQQMRAANQRSEDIKLSGYGRGTASGASRGGVGGGEFSVGFGFSKTWDPSRDIQDLQLSRQERIAELTEAEITNRSLSSLGSQMWLLDDLLAKRTDLAKAIETYEETIRLNEGIEKGSSQDRLVRLSQARSALEDARRARDENEHRIKSVTTELERTMVVTPKDKVVFSESYRASNVFTSFPYLQYEKYITRTTEGDKVVDVLNEEGKSLLDRSGREAVEAQAHLSAMKARLPLLRAQQVEGIFVSRGETEKAAQAKALRETFERAFQQGTPANSEAIQRALQALTALTENENMNPLPDEMLVTLMETHLVEFANLRGQAFANSQDSPEKAYEDLRELSLVALKLLAIKASMSPALKWGSPDGMALDRLISDWDQSFMGRYDPYTSQRIALNTAESYQAGATKTGNSEPVTVNIDFISLFTGGSGTRVGIGFNPAQIPLALFKIPQKNIEEIFSWSRPIVDKALKSDPEGFGKFLSKWIPGYQSSVLRDRSIAAQLRLAWIEIITAEQRWKDVINAQDSFITQLVLAQKMQKLAQAKVTLMEQIEPESAGHLPETDLRNAENNAALLIARRELGEYNKRVFDLKIALLALGIDPNNLPYVNEEVARMDRVTFSYSELASKDAVETKLAVYRAMFAREEFRSAEIARGMPQMPLSVGITGDGERKAAFVSVDLLDPDLVVLKSDVDAALDRVKVADLLISETKAGQAGRINGDMQAYFTGVVRREMSKEIHDIFVRRMNWLERAGYRGQEERNAVSILDFQAIKGIEQGGAGAAGALYQIRTIFGQTNLGLSVDLPNPMDVLAIGKATKAVFSRLPVATPGVTAIFGGNPGQFSEQARLKVKENEGESEKTKVLLPKINLSAFSEPINGRTLTLSVRWNLWGSGGTERRAIIENEKKEIQAYLEEKQRVHQAFVEQNESDMARSIAKISDINREIAELTERARAQGLQKDYIDEKIQMGDVASYQARLAELVATRAYEFWMLALKYQSTADILKVYGQEIPPLDDVLRDAGIGTIPEGSRSFYEEFTSGPLAETPRPLPVRRDSSKEWNAAQVRAQAPLYKPAKVEQNPEPTVSSVLNVLGQRVDVPLSHLSFKGPSWFEKMTTQMAEAIGMHLDDSRLLNSSDFAVFVDGIFDNYRFPKTPQFMARFQSAFIAVNREFKDLTDSSEMPNSFAKYTEQPFKERFPFHALLTADTETSMRMDKNFHKKFALALFLASEMTNYPDRDNPKWMELVIKDISQNIRLGNRERKGYRLTAKEKEVYFARKRDFSAAMDRALLMPFFSDGKGVAHASEVSQQYNAAAHQGLQRLFPELSRWTERLNEEKSERGGENRNNGQGSSFSRYGNLDEESLIASMTAIAVSNGWSPETLKGYLFFLAESIAPQIGRYTKGATIRDYAQQPDADLLRALLQDYHQSSEKEPENKAIQEDKIEFLSESEKAKFIIATSFIWAGEYFKAMKIDPARAVKDPEAKARIARDFTQTMDRMIALRGMPEVSEIIKRQGAAAEGRIYWFSTDVLGILTAFSIDWVREKWTENELKSHLGHMIQASKDPEFLSDLARYLELTGVPTERGLNDPDPAKRVKAWGDLSAGVKALREAYQKELARGKISWRDKEAHGIGDLDIDDLRQALKTLLFIHQQASLNGIPLVPGSEKYFYEYFNNLRAPDNRFLRDESKPLEKDIAQFFSDYANVRNVRLNAVRSLLATGSPLSSWVASLDPPEQEAVKQKLESMKENIEKFPNEDEAAIYLAGQEMRLRGMTPAAVKLLEQRRLFIQAINFVFHGTEKPRTLDISDIDSWISLIERGILKSEAQVAKRFKFASHAQIAEINQLNRFSKEDRNRVPLMSPAHLRGLATRADELGQSLADTEGWIADSATIQEQRQNATGASGFLPIEIVNSLVEPFRRTAGRLSEYLAWSAGKRLGSTGRTDDIFTTPDLRADDELARRILLVSLGTEGELLAPDRVNWSMESWKRIAKTHGDRGMTEGQISAVQSEFAQRMSIAGQVFEELVGIPVRMQGSVTEDVRDRIAKEKYIYLQHVAPKMEGFFIRYRDRQDRIAELNRADVQEKETMRDLLRRVEEDRSRRKEELAPRWGDPNFQRDKMSTLRNIALSHRDAAHPKGLYLDQGELRDLIRRMASRGFTENEALERYYYLPHRLAKEVLGRDFEELTKYEKGLLADRSERILDRFQISRPDDVLFAEKTFGLTPDAVVDREVSQFKEDYEVANKVGDLFYEFGHPLASFDKALSVAQNMRKGAVTIEDLVGWLQVDQALHNAALALDVDGFDSTKALFMSELFKLGIADRPDSEIVPWTEGQKEEFKKEALMLLRGKDLIGERPDQLNTDQQAELVRRMIERRIPASTLHMFLDRMEKVLVLQAELRRRALTRDPVNDPRRSVVGDFDLFLKMSPLEIFVYVDHTNADSRTRLDLASILGYDTRHLERRVLRPATAAFSQAVRDALYDRVPPETWQQSWSALRRIQYARWKEAGWGNGHTVLLIGFVFATGQFLYQVYKRFLKFKGESEKVREEHQPTWFQVIFFTERTFITASIVGGLLTVINLNFFTPWTGLLLLTAYYLYTVISSHYFIATQGSIVMAFIKRFSKDPAAYGADSYFDQKIMDAKRITREAKTNIVIGFFMPYDREGPNNLKQQNMKNDYSLMVNTQAIPLLFADYQANKRDGVLDASGRPEQHLYYSFVPQVRGQTGGNPTQEEFNAVVTGMEERLGELLGDENLKQLQKEGRLPADANFDDVRFAVRRRLYFFYRDRPVFKPFMHYLVRRWLRETDGERDLAERWKKNRQGVWEKETDPDKIFNVDPDLQRALNDPGVRENMVRLAQNDPQLRMEAIIQALLDEKIRPQLFERVRKLQNIPAKVRQFWISLEGTNGPGWRNFNALLNPNARSRQNARNELSRYLQLTPGEVDGLVEWLLSINGIRDKVLATKPGQGNPYQNSIRHVAGGDPEDKDDLRNIRTEDIKGAGSTPKPDRSSQIKHTVAYDSGNELEYRDLYTWIAAAHDSRNKAFAFRGSMLFAGQFSSLHSLVGKDYPQRSLNFMQSVQMMVQGSARTPGKYVTKDEVYYKEFILAQGYEAIWAYYQFLTAINAIRPKSEDEINTILAGIMHLVRQVQMKEDPTFSMLQDSDREEAKWIPVFDIEQIIIFRFAPFVRDHPRVAAFVGASVVSFLAWMGVWLVSPTLAWIPALVALALVYVGLAIPAIKFSRALKEHEEKVGMVIPRMSPSHLFESNLVLRGLIGETIFLVQLLTSATGMVYPGLIEVAFSFPAEWIFFGTMFVIFLPMFSKPAAAFFRGELMANRSGGLPRFTEPLIPRGMKEWATFFSSPRDWARRMNIFYTRVIHTILLLGITFDEKIFSQTFMSKLITRPFFNLFLLLRKSISTYRQVVYPDQPSAAMAWPPFEIHRKNVPILTHLLKNRIPFVLGLSFSMVALLPWLGSLFPGLDLGARGIFLMGTIVGGLLAVGFHSHFKPRYQKPSKERLHDAHPWLAAIADRIVPESHRPSRLTDTHGSVGLIRKFFGALYARIPFAPNFKIIEGIEDKDARKAEKFLLLRKFHIISLVGFTLGLVMAQSILTMNAINALHVLWILPFLVLIIATAINWRNPDPAPEQIEFLKNIILVFLPAFIGASALALHEVFPIASVLRAGTIVFAGFFMVSSWSYFNGIVWDNAVSALSNLFFRWGPLGQKMANWLTRKTNDGGVERLVYQLSSFRGWVGVAIGVYFGLLHPEVIGEFVMGISMVVVPGADGSITAMAAQLQPMEQHRAPLGFVMFFTTLMAGNVFWGLIFYVVGILGIIFTYVFGQWWLDKPTPPSWRKPPVSWIAHAGKSVIGFITGATKGGIRGWGRPMLILAILAGTLFGGSVIAAPMMESVKGISSGWASIGQWFALAIPLVLGGRMSLESIRRQRLEVAAKDYFDLLNKGQPLDVNSPPLAILLLGNPFLQSVTDLAAKWKQGFKNVPIVLAGGKGPGTPGLLASVKKKFQVDETKIVEFLKGQSPEVYGNREFGPDNITEADLMRFALLREGVPSNMIHQESNPSSTIEENFRNTQDILTGIIGEGHPNVGVVTGAPMRLRFGAVASKLETSLSLPYKPVVLDVGSLDLSALSIDELVNLVQIRAGAEDRTWNEVAGWKQQLSRALTSDEENLEKRLEAARVQVLDRLKDLELGRSINLPGKLIVGILALSALFYSSNPFAATLAGSVTTSFVLATIGQWMLVPVMLFPVLLVGVYRRQVSVLGASWVGSISERLDQVQNFFKSLTGSIVPLGANLAEKILKSPAAMATVVVGLASLAGAAGFHLMGSTAGTSGVASAAGVPALFVMALSATSVGAGSSAVFTRWELAPFLERLRRAGGFLATPGFPSAEKKGDALVVDMRKGTMDSGVGKILLDRLASIGMRSMDDPDGKVHVEFVVGKTPTPEDVNRITIAFRHLALSSDLSQSAIDKISIGVVAQETEGLKARLNDLSAFHISVVAPANAVEFWAGLGMPLTVFAAKLLADLTRVEVDIIYTGAAARAVEALSNGAIKADEKGQVRLKALATPLQVIDQDNRKINTFNQQA